MSRKKPTLAAIRQELRLVENAIKRIVSLPNGWVRVERIGVIRSGLELCFAVHSGRRGKKIATWSIRCLGVREAKLTDFDGGGLALYASDHPAAKQYVAPRAELRWARSGDQAAALATLYHAHIDAVDDWIPFERYVLPKIPSACGFEPASRNEFAFRGPDFLIRAYARALRTGGERVQAVLKVAKRKIGRPGVLHFGESYVVADKFVTQREELSLQRKSVTV